MSTLHQFEIDQSLPGQTVLGKYSYPFALANWEIAVTVHPSRSSYRTASAVGDLSPSIGAHLQAPPPCPCLLISVHIAEFPMPMPLAVASETQHKPGLPCPQAMSQTLCPSIRRLSAEEEP